MSSCRGNDSGSVIYTPNVIFIHSALTNTYSGFSITHHTTSLIYTSSYFLQQKLQTAFIIISIMFEQSTSGEH